MTEDTQPVAQEWEHGNETILVCEDEPSLRRLTASLLTECGYRVIEAENGEQAVRLAAEHTGQFRLLITDVVMPGMKGDTVAETILKDQPTVPVLFMSGYTSDVVSFESLAQKGMGFLQKLFKPDTLLQRVREMLDNVVK